MKRFVLLFGSMSLLCASGGCKTKAEIRREQELERLKAEVQENRGDKADFETQNEQLKEEMARLSSLMEERGQQNRQNVDEMKKELTALSARVQALEQRAVTEELQVKTQAEEKAKASYDSGKRLFDDGKYEDAAETFRQVLSKSHPKGDEAKKTHFLLAESLFAAKDFASAALEFSEFQKNYPKDALVPTAIYRQANAFRNLGKSKEAKLFYSELMDRYPKSPLAAKAKNERKRLK